jgi:3-hydroxybutyryl-CoA dehydrogenase
MRIAILAGEHQKPALQQKLSADSVELIWADSLKSLTVIEADHYFDCQFDHDSTRTQHLNSLANHKNVWVNAVSSESAQIGEKLIRFNGWNTFIEKPIWEVVAIDEGAAVAVKALMQLLDAKFQLIPDLVGMITPRVVAMLVNEAYYTFEMEVSSKEEIDIAMKLGTNYPYGPFEWADKIGLNNIYELLNNLALTDSRYTISKALAEAAGIKTYKW